MMDAGRGAKSAADEPSANGGAGEDAAATIETIKQAARQRGVRWTTQRQIIVESFIASGDHLTVEELHNRVKEVDRTVSAATVYRTVNLLVDIGVATKRHFGDASAVFESTINKVHHHHLVCLSCGAIVEFHSDEIDTIQEGIAKDHGYHLVRHRLDMYGICPVCRKAGVTEEDLGKAGKLPIDH